jgi:hypothetical protein
VQGVTYRCSLAGGFHVLSEHGETLDPTSAAVLVALGGDEPEWLPTVDALTRVYQAFPGHAGAMQQAAAALEAGARPDSLAKTTTSMPALLALAAIGCAAVGANPHCDTYLWNLLLYHRDLKVARRALAMNPVLPPCLGNHEDQETRTRVARNPACTANQLERLAHDGSPQVRLAVAGNPSAGAHALREGARDPEWPVRQAVARHPSCPSDCVRRLLRDPIAQVRAAMVLNPIVRRGVLASRVRDPTPAVHVALASRVELKGRFSGLERRARADDARSYAQTRAALKRNPSCPELVHRRLKAIERKLEALPPGRLVALEERKRAMRENKSIAYLGTRELVSGWLVVVVVMGLSFVGAGYSTSPYTGQPHNPALGAFGGVLVVTTVLATVGVVIAKGPFLGWYPARRPRSIAGAMPLIALAFLFVVAFVASTGRVAWRLVLRSPLARLRFSRGGLGRGQE